MSKGLKTVALIVGVAALAVTGIGLVVAPGALGALAGVSAAANVIGLSTLFSIGIAGLSLGTTPGAKDIERTGANSRGQVFADPNAHGVFLFGTTAAPLALVYEQLHGVNSDRVSNIIAHAWHEIESYVSLKIETETVLFSFTAGVGTALGAWAGIVEWRRNLGAPGQTALAVADGVGGEFNWPSTAVFTNVAHSCMTWNFFADPDSDKLQGGVPSQVDLVAEAAMLYDPREDNAYGSGSQDFADASTWTFNNGNAALVLLRYIIGEYTPSGDLIWGRGAAESDIDMDTFVAMADVADETLDGKPRYRLGGMHLLDGSFEGFVRRWEQETGGKLSKSGGVYRVWLPHDDLTPLTTITDADILANTSIGHTIGEIDLLFNTARGRYIEPTQGYKGFPYPEVNEPTAIADDGHKRILNHDFSWVQDVEIAQRTVRQMVRRSRFLRTWSVTLGWKGQSPNYRPFTVHNLITKETGLDTQLVRVIDRRMSLNGPTVLVLQQEHPAIYDDSIALLDEHSSNEIVGRIDRLGTLTPRYRDGSPLDPTAPGGNLVTDPTFNRRAALWEIQASDNSRFTYHWGTNKPDYSEIVAGAGVAGDNALRLHEHDGVGTGIVRSIGRPGMSSFVNGQTVQIAVRVRKRDAGTLGFGSLEFRVAVMAQDSSTATDDTGVLFTVGDINGWTADVWQQAIAQVTVSEDFLSGEPFIGLDIFWDFDDGTVPMRVDVDMASMSVIATP